MLENAKIAVVVPAYNESVLIRSVLQSIPAYVDKIIVVDDGSDDRTSDLALGNGDERMVVIKHTSNRGVGAAIATGYSLSLQLGADITAIVAADGQMDPKDLHSLLSPILDGDADYTKGDRLSHPQARTNMPISRFVGNHILSLCTRWATGLPIRDSQCGYTAISCRALRKLPLELLWPRYGYPNDLLGWIAKVGLVVQDVVVQPIYGEERSGVGLRHALFVVPFVLLRIFLRRIGMLSTPKLPTLADPEKADIPNPDEPGPNRIYHPEVVAGSAGLGIKSYYGKPLL